jgi:hypothetical protein
MAWQVTATYNLMLEKKKFEIGAREPKAIPRPQRSHSSEGVHHQGNPLLLGAHRSVSTGGSRGSAMRKSYRCKKCDHLDTASMLADAKLLAELQTLLHEAHAQEEEVRFGWRLSFMSIC